MPVQGHEVKFYFVPEGQDLPAILDNDAVYFDANTGQVRIGTSLISDVADLSDYTVKSVVVTGEGDYISNVSGPDADGVVTVTKAQSDFSKVYYKTTAEWDAGQTTISEAGAIYVYSDYKQYHGADVPGIKVGNGTTTIPNLPFITDELYDHIADSTIHVTAEEKAIWNSKVNVSINEATETLEFTTTQ